MPGGVMSQQKSAFNCSAWERLLFLFTYETSTDICYASIQIQAVNGSVSEEKYEIYVFHVSYGFTFWKEFMGYFAVCTL